MATRYSALSQALYEKRQRSVLRALRNFGVAKADLDDVCHDVFLVAHAKANQVQTMPNPEAWLYEVARRTASAHRRRAFRRSEIPWADPERMAQVEDQEPELDRVAYGKLRDALLRLEPNRCETLLYSDLTDVSVSDLARLLDCDRKTARKRLLSARQRMGRLLSDPERVVSVSPRATERSRQSPLFDPSCVAPDPVSPEAVGGFQVVARGPMFAAGVLGRVFMTVWRRASLEEIEMMAAAAARVYHAAGGQFAYLTLVEAECPPPAFSSRSRLAEIVREARKYLSSYATVLSGGPSAFVVPIMNVIFFLTSPPFPVRFFGSIPDASHWTLERSGFDLDPAELGRAFEELCSFLGPLS